MRLVKMAITTGAAGSAFALALATANALPAAAVTPAAVVRVSVASPPTPFSQNKQNEPALAVDAQNPT